MGAKKKVEVQPPPPPPAPEKITNIILKVFTSEGTEFQVSEDLLTRHSQKARMLAEASKDGSIRLNEIDSQSFEVIMAYLEMHKEKEPIKIMVPIRSNQSLKHIMSEPQAELIESVVEKGDAMLLKVMDAALLLEMESLRRRLSCAVAIKLMRFTIEEIREEYDLDDQKFEEDALRNSMKPLIEQIKKNNMEEES